MSIYCTKCGAENIDNARFCRSCGNQLKQADNQTTQASSKGLTDNKSEFDYSKIGGWLLLLGLGIFFMPFSFLNSMSEYYKSIDVESLKMLTDQSSELYNHSFTLLFGFEKFMNWSLLIVSFSFWYFFFQRKRIFPKLFIGFVVINIAFQLIDMAMVSSLFPDIEVEAGNYSVIFRMIIYAAIWIPYLLISERANKTFVN